MRPWRLSRSCAPLELPATTMCRVPISFGTNVRPDDASRPGGPTTKHSPARRAGLCLDDDPRAVGAALPARACRSPRNRGRQELGKKVVVIRLQLGEIRLGMALGIQVVLIKFE